MEIYKMYKHNPPHLFQPNAKYFITGAIYQRQRLLLSESAKERVLKSLKIGFNSFGWVLEDWVILNNHYHVIAGAPSQVDTLPAIMRDIHKFTGNWIKTHVKGVDPNQKVWWNYWDTCVTYKRSYFARLNYLWYNPQHHNLTDNAGNWKYGSLYQRIRDEKKYIDHMRNEYSFDKLNIKDDF